MIKIKKINELRRLPLAWMMLVPFNATQLHSARMVSLSWSHLTIIESSAYFKMALFSYLLWHVLVYRINNKGESIHPCGGASWEATWADRTQFISTLWVLLQLTIQGTRFVFRSNCSKRLLTCVEFQHCVSAGIQESSIRTVSFQLFNN